MGLTRANLETIASRTGRKVVAAWSGRDAGQMGTVYGVVLHHTGSAWTSAVAPTLGIVRDGRSDLQNALCTFYIDKAGTIYLITEKIAWHAGAGSWRGITDGNGHFLGIEAESDGKNWTADTIESYVRLVAEICRFLGVDPGTWAIRHATWAPTRKIDFSGIDEADFRARISARLTGQPGDDDMPYDQWPKASRDFFLEDVKASALDPMLKQYFDAYLVNALFNSADHHGNDQDNPVGHAVSGHKFGKQASDKADQILAALAGGLPVTVDAGAVAAALAQNPGFLAALAKAVNDVADLRARDGNPTTGPVS